MEILDWAIMLGGLAGFVGTIRGWKTFMNEEQMETWITRYGRQRVRTVVAIVYLIMGLAGGALVMMH